MTFGTYAAKWWTAECPYCEARIARGTPITIGYRKVRRSYLDNHILPRFKDVELARIATRMIESWVMALCKASEITPTTINHSLRTLKIMLGEAVRLGYMAVDPSKSVRQLRETPEERGILTLEEIRAVLDEKKIGKIWDGDYRHFALNLTAASCGSGKFSGSPSSTFTLITWKSSRHGARKTAYKTRSGTRCDSFPCLLGLRQLFSESSRRTPTRIPAICFSTGSAGTFPLRTRLF
jgi:hypothetical protein